LFLSHLLSRQVSSKAMTFNQSTGKRSQIGPEELNSFALQVAENSPLPFFAAANL
jgi:hypothetical protein